MTQQRRGGMPVTQQQATVIDEMINNPVTVVGAGAGSGKTHTMVAAVMELIDQGASAEQFILVTFTNAAADEIRKRLEEAVQARLASAIPAQKRQWREQQERLALAYIGTIHGLCNNILRTFGYGEDVAREADITFSRMTLSSALEDAVEAHVTDPAAAPVLLREPLEWEEHELRKKARQILEYLRNRGIDPVQMAQQTQAQSDDPGKPYRCAMAALVADADTRYRSRKAERQALDAGDLLGRTADLLTGKSGTRVARLICARYRYLFLDEFQDTDRTQKQIADALKPELRRLLVVGDRKQSIYDFRGADDTLLDEIAEENGVPVLPLSLSRRPTDRLLRAQNALFASIGSNPNYQMLREPLEPYEGTISPQSGIAPLTYISATGDNSAARLQARLASTASEIAQMLGRSIDDPKTGEMRPVEPGDIVLLTRSNNGLRQYLTGLPSLLPPGVEIRAETGGRFFQRPEIVASYRMLQFILEYPDHVVLSMALQTPYLKDAMPGETEQWILQYRPGEGSPLKDWFEGRHKDYSQKLKDLRSAVRRDTVPQILSRLYDSFRIREHYRDGGDSQAVENLEKLREMARHLFKNEQALTLRQFVDRLRIDILNARDESDAIVELDEGIQRPSYIRIMTIHSAKGLEFPLVIIPDVHSPLLHPDNDPDFLVIPGWGLDIALPTGTSLDTRSPRFQSELNGIRQRRLREEMRLFYVAVTRAQHAVTLIGTKAQRNQLNDPGDDFYSWQDEVLRARTSLPRKDTDFRFQ